MESVRHNCLRLSVLSVLVFTFALAWVSPHLFASAAWAQQPTQEPTPDQNQKQSTTFTGTIAHNGKNYVLRDSSGATYTLDDAERAKQFEGKTVKVTGQLDQEAKLIHVENIETVAA